MRGRGLLQSTPNEPSFGFGALAPARWAGNPHLVRPVQWRRVARSASSSASFGFLRRSFSACRLALSCRLVRLSVRCIGASASLLRA